MQGGGVYPFGLSCPSGTAVKVACGGRGVSVGQGVFIGVVDCRGGTVLVGRRLGNAVGMVVGSGVGLGGGQ